MTFLAHLTKYISKYKIYWIECQTQTVLLFLCNKSQFLWRIRQKKFWSQFLIDRRVPTLLLCQQQWEAVASRIIKFYGYGYYIEPYLYIYLQNWRLPSQSYIRFLFFIRFVSFSAIRVNQSRGLVVMTNIWEYVLHSSYLILMSVIHYIRDEKSFDGIDSKTRDRNIELIMSLVSAPSSILSSQLRTVCRSKPDTQTVNEKLIWRKGGEGNQFSHRFSL